MLSDSHLILAFHDYQSASLSLSSSCRINPRWLNSDVTFEGNQAVVGGAIYVNEDVKLFLQGYKVLFENNHAVTGGALAIFGSHLQTLWLTFRNNTALVDTAPMTTIQLNWARQLGCGVGNGGAICFSGYPTELTAELLATVLTGNRAVNGGAIYNAATGNCGPSCFRLIAANCTIDDNVAQGGGGGAIYWVHEQAQSNICGANTTLDLLTQIYTSQMYARGMIADQLGSPVPCAEWSVSQTSTMTSTPLYLNLSHSIIILRATQRLEATETSLHPRHFPCALTPTRSFTNQTTTLLSMSQSLIIMASRSTESLTKTKSSWKPSLSSYPTKLKSSAPMAQHHLPLSSSGRPQGCNLSRSHPKPRPESSRQQEGQQITLAYLQGGSNSLIALHVLTLPPFPSASLKCAPASSMSTPLLDLGTCASHAMLDRTTSIPHLLHAPTAPTMHYALNPHLEVG